MSQQFKIKCPKCDWEPTSNSIWCCTCGARWNTFDTYGVCPECSKKWEMTQCCFCHVWSKHDDWYQIPVDFRKLTEYSPEQEGKEQFKPSLIQKLIIGMDLGFKIRQRAKKWVKDQNSYFRFFPGSEDLWYEISRFEPETIDSIETGMSLIISGSGFKPENPLKNVSIAGFRRLMEVLRLKEISRQSRPQFSGHGNMIDEYLVGDGGILTINMFNEVETEVPF